MGWLDAFLTFALGTESFFWTLLGCGLLATCIITNGADQGFIWAGERDEGDHPFFQDNYRVHRIDALQEWAYYALALMTGANWLALAGTSMLFRPVFQGLSNLGGTGRWTEGEPEDFRLWEGFALPKWWPGRWKVLKAGFGLVLLVLHVPLSHKLARVVRWIAALFS